jgi:DNA-binding transcriptional regulator GbsR (MarR family)
MDRMTASFVDGMGAAAATSGVLTQQQGRIFALLYLQDGPLSLEEIADELEQSKSNVSLNIRVLVDWHLVRRKPVAGSRRDHYEAAVDFFRAMQEIFERRFRWTVRQVLVAIEETGQTASHAGLPRDRVAFLEGRLEALAAFFAMVDAGIGMFVEGKAFPADQLRSVGPAAREGRARRSTRGSTR